MSIKLSHSAPDGFVVHSHAGDDFVVCREYVRLTLGIERRARSEPCRMDCRRSNMPPIAADRPRKVRGGANLFSGEDDIPPSAAAIEMWRASTDPRGTLVERYLASRGLEVDDVAGDVVRWNAGAGCMTALFRDILTDEPKAISRTFLDGDGRKIERKFFGPVGGCAIKLDGDEEVAHGLHLCEGIETGLTGRQCEAMRPMWALGSKGAIGAFPLLNEIEALTILAEPGAEREVETCAARWDGAGREVFINRSLVGSDINDALMARAVQL